MSAYLVISILFSSQLLRSSASFLTTTKLSEELSETNSITASAIGPPITSLETSLTPLSLLSGYVGYARYSDDSCTSQMKALFVALNVCIARSEDDYDYYTATSSSITITSYTDSLCTVVSSISSDTQSYVDGACEKKRKVFVASTITANPSAATVQIR